MAFDTFFTIECYATMHTTTNTKPDRLANPVTVTRDSTIVQRRHANRARGARAPPEILSMLQFFHLLFSTDSKSA